MAFFKALCVEEISSTVADLPVPIAHIGSYAIIRFSYVISIPSNCDSRYCITASNPFSRICRGSPIQYIISKSCSWKKENFCATRSWDSPNFSRRSLWPMRMVLISNSSNCSKPISPVYAPFTVGYAFCTPSVNSPS